MNIREKEAIEVRNMALGEMLNILDQHPRFSYLIKQSSYYKTFHRNKTKPPSSVTRWHSLSVDWKTPFASTWKALWHVSTNVSDSEYLELRGLVKDFDEDLREELTNLPIGKLLRSLMTDKVKEPT